jgi:hypothetical protein
MDKIFQLEWPLWVLYGVAILVSLYLARRMRKKGLDPYPTREKFEKHKKTIDKVTNIFCGGVIILAAAVMIFGISLPLREIINPIAPLDEKTQILELGLVFMQLTWFLGLTSFFIGMTTYFQQNLTKKKRIILLIVSIVPVCFFITWAFIDDGTPSLTKLKFAFSYCSGIAIINGPGIVSGTSFFELATKIYNKFERKIEQS